MSSIGQPSIRNRLNRSVNDVYTLTRIQKDISISEKTDKQVSRTSDTKLDFNRNSNLGSSTLLTSGGLQRCSMQVMPSINVASSYPNPTTGKTRSPIPKVLLISIFSFSLQRFLLFPPKKFSVWTGLK